MANYTDKTKIEAYLKTTIPSSQNTWLDIVMGAVTEFIDGYLGRTFNPVTEARYFDGVGDGNIIVDDFTGTPTISILDDRGTVVSTFGVSDYNLYPLNGSIKNIIHLNGIGSYSRFPYGSKTVKVTAAWGYGSTVPSGIVLAATMLAAKLYNGTGAEGEVSSESLGDYSISYRAVADVTDADPTVQSLLNQYKQYDL